MKFDVSFICFLSVWVDVYGFIKDLRKFKVEPEPDPSANGTIVPMQFRQKLDHFHKSNDKYWTQRSWYNNEFVHSTDSPIFLMVAGEAPANPVWLRAGSWYSWARTHNAMLYLLEHRFYGESHPTKDASVENLVYLTSQQALADIAYFITETNQRNNYTANNKWILFGGSYPGDLVAWSRLHYPKQVFGSISSSGPLMAKADFTEYNDVVRHSLNYFVPGCADIVTQAIKQIQKMMAEDSGAKEVFDKFNICSKSYNSTSWLDQVELYMAVTNGLAGIVQYNNQSPFTITDLCDMYLMNETLGNSVDRLAAFTKRNTNGTSPCSDVSYNDAVTYFRTNNWSSSPNAMGGRVWYFQTCNEFGFYQTSESKESLFSDTIPLRYFTQLCTDLFGKKFNVRQLNQAVRNVNRRNQGTDIKVTNVVFVQGNIDPWHALGKVRTPTSEDPYVLINGTSHCYDMYPPEPSDSTSLKNARDLIAANLEKWLTS